MSKLMIVLCTVAIFGSALAASLEALNRNGGEFQFDDLIGRIAGRIEKAHQQVDALGTQPSEQNYDIIAHFKNNVTKQIERAIGTIRRDMRALRVNFTESKCKFYFDEYERLAERVQSQLDNCLNAVVISVIERFSDAINRATEIQTRLMSLRGSDFQEHINRGLGSVVDYAIENIDEAFADFMKLNDGTLTEKAVFEDTDFKYYIAKEEDVFNNFLNCALTSRKKHKKPAVSPPQ